MDDFELHRKRDLVRESMPPPPNSGPLEHAVTSIGTAKNSVSPKPSLAKPVLSLEREPSLLEIAADDGLAILRSPKVSASEDYSHFLHPISGVSLCKLYPKVAGSGWIFRKISNYKE